jgi:2-aminoadipate transaminase
MTRSVTGPGTTQIADRPGVVDLGPGHSSPSLYPSRELARAVEEVLRDAPGEALAYGANRGPAPLVEWLSSWLANVHGSPVDPSRILVTAGASAALDRLCSLFTRPGDAVLCEAPTYHLALAQLASRRLHVVPVASDARGPTPDALERAAREVPAAQEHVLFYTVPVHSNPRGASIPRDRWSSLCTVAKERGIHMVRDDVYAPLTYAEGVVHPIRADADADATVTSLGSFSKIVAPGLRVGWMITDPEVVDRLGNDGLARSGGGPSHTAAMIVARLCGSSGWDGHLRRLRREYSERRDVLVGALEAELGDLCEWQPVEGGFFVWLRFRHDLDAKTMLREAERHRVSYIPGSEFFPASVAGEGRRYARLSFSYHPADKLREGVSRLAHAWSTPGVPVYR